MLPFYKSKNPAHRALAVERQVRVTRSFTGDDEWQEGLARCMLGDLDVPKELAHAYSIYMSTSKRERVEALLLAKATPADVLACLDIEPSITKVYHHLFFDTGVFESRLDRIQYAEEFEAEGPEDSGALWKTKALHEGLEYLKVLFGGVDYAVSPQKMIQQIINKSYLITGSLDEYGVDSGGGREIRQWALTGVKGISQLPTAADMSGQDNTGDLLYQLDRQKQISDGSRRVKDDVAPDQIMTGIEKEKSDA